MKMYEYEIGEIIEEGDKTSVTGVENLEQYKKLSKEIKRLNNALTESITKILLGDII